MKESFFVDLPNFYSHLLKISNQPLKSVRDYFVNWLDFDRLASALSATPQSIWVFYSGGKLGPSKARIDGGYLTDYISRINRLVGVTARNVNIPGEQREPIKYHCEKCDFEGQAEWVSEKGIDSTLTVSMFDTMNSWDIAYLLSGDADFVPAVAALRRKGKMVIGIGFEDASNALVRECYNYIDTWNSILVQDYAVYTIFQDGGIGDILFSETAMGRAEIGNSIKFYLEGFSARDGFSLGYVGPLDNTKLNKAYEEFDSGFPGLMERDRTSFRFMDMPHLWEGVERRLDFLLQKYSQATLIDSGIDLGLQRTIDYDAETKEYG